MQQTKKFKMADAISPYLAVSCGLRVKMCPISSGLTEPCMGINDILSMTKSHHGLNHWYNALAWTSPYRTLHDVHAKTTWSPFCRRHFQTRFSNWNSLDLDANFIEIWFRGFNQQYMMTSSNGNIFRRTRPLWGESTGASMFSLICA